MSSDIVLFGLVTLPWNAFDAFAPIRSLPLLVVAHSIVFVLQISADC